MKEFEVILNIPKIYFSILRLVLVTNISNMLRLFNDYEVGINPLSDNLSVGVVAFRKQGK